MIDREKQAQAASKAIREAQETWTGWDWTEDFAGHDDNPVYYSGRPADDDDGPGADQAREYAAQVESDAAGAHDQAEQAIECIDAGNYARAVVLMERASRLERQYGDDPAYGPALKLTIELAETK